MAFNLGDIFVTFKANTDALKKGLSDVQDVAEKTKGFGDQMTKYLQNSADASKQFATGLGIAGAAAVGFGVLTIKAFSESQDLIAQTNAVLKSTGGVAGVTADAVTKLASALERQTKFSDEDVRSVENLLLTFTSIGKDIMPQATETVLDMATALGEDTKSASIQLGKALQDPVLGITALRRVGVNFNDAQKEVIQNLVDTGQSAKAQQLIMAELTKEFGGSAKAAGDTFAGKLARLNNQLNNVEEAIGQVLVNALQPLIEGMLDWIDKAGGVEGIMKKLTAAIQKIQPWLPAISGAIIGGLVPAAIAATIAFGAWFLTMLPWFALGAAIALAIQHWDDITRIFGSTVDWIKDRFNDFKKVVEDIAGSVLKAFKDRIDDVKDAFSAVQGWLEKHKKGLTDIGIVISIILIPTFIRLSAQAIATGVTSGASAVASGAAWALQAVVAGAAWTLQFGIMVAKAIWTGIMNAPAAIASGAVWAFNALVAGAAWLLQFGLMIGAGVVAAGSMVASAVMAGIAWVIALGPITLAIIAVGLAAYAVIRNWDTVKTFFIGLWNGITGAISAFIGWLGANWPVILAILTGPIGIAVLIVMRNADTIRNIFGSLIGWLAGAWNGLVDWFGGAFGRISNFANNIAGSISGAFSGAMQNVRNVVVGAVNWLVDRANGLIHGINNISGKLNIPRIGDIPRLFTGAQNFGGGLAIVGDIAGQGGEMAMLPPGTKVFSNSESKDILGGKGVGGSTTTNINGTINIGSEVDADEFFRRLTRGQELARRGIAAPNGNLG